MTILQLQAQHASTAWSVIGFERTLSFLTTVLAVFAEAQEQARVAHNRTPFAAW
jgi:hypothetical protein